MEVWSNKADLKGGLLFVPPTVAVLSLVSVSLKALQAFSAKGKDVEAVSLSTTGDADGREEIHSTLAILEKLDGPVIVMFRILRLVIALLLIALEAFELSAGQGTEKLTLQAIFLCYMALLAIMSICNSARWRDISSRQLTSLLFLDFAIYFYLDGWAYAVVSDIPRYSPVKSVALVRLALLFFGGLIIPLAMPRPFRSSSKNEEPSASETASLFSRYTFSYMDGIIIYANRVLNVTIKDMPQVPVPGRIEALAQRVLAALDPVNVGKRHVLWGVLQVWGKEYLLLNAIWALHAILAFAGPYGTRNLLEYLETGVSPHDLKPWVWITILVIGDLISACLFTHFMFVAAHVIVEGSSAFQYLVFHHALRIRLKNNVLDSSAKNNGKEPETPAESTTLSTEGPNAESTNVNGTDNVETPSIASGASLSPEGGHSKEKTSYLVGKINNLITTDIQALSQAPFVVVLPGTFLHLIISIIFLYKLLGWSSFVGMAVMVLCAPIPFYYGRRIAMVQKSKMGATDKRVQYVTEAMGVLRMIKLFNWQPYMLTQLDHRREEELVKIRTVRILEAAMNISSAMLPLLSKLVVIALYTLVSKGELKASRIFAALMVFTMMEEQLSQIIYLFPEILRAKVSYDRFTEFLNSTELLVEHDSSPSASERNALATPSPIVSVSHERDTIGFKQCSFSWDRFGDGASSAPSNDAARKQFVLRFDDEVVFKPAKVNIIVGPTASGKTSLLMALLGETYYKPHGIGSWYNLPRDGGVAYAAQESWVLNETVRENILFGEPYNEDRYKKVLKQCALERDLELWKAGDLTEVGEKGLTLSGGQKARITLARAIYSSASILLLDDVLAALDVHTGKWVVEKALQGDLVLGRTVLLVTHNVALTASIAVHVVVLQRDGTISAQGSVAEVLRRDSLLRAQIEKEREEVEEDVETKVDENVKDEDANANAGRKNAAGQLVVAEEKAIGRVEMAAIMLYLASVGGPLIWAAILGSRLFQMLVQISQTWFMGYWSNQYETHSPAEVPVLRYLYLFIFLNLMGFLTALGSEVFWIFRSVKASKIIHHRLLQSIFTSTFRWLDITPVGRIITRCTQDMSAIDEQLGHMMSPFIATCINLVCLLISTVVMAGWYALVSGVVVTVLGFSLGMVYLKCQMSIRREMSNAKAPVMSQVGAALAGLPSIRAYRAQTIFDTELRKRIDRFARTAYCSYDISRWMSIRMDSLSAIFAGVVAAYLVYGGRVEAGYAGFTLSIVLAFSRLILDCVRYYYLLELQANSLERMLEFMRIDHEPGSTENGRPPAYWPSSGELRIEKLSARYSVDSPTVLRDISFHVKSGERVGIVGRTGAGKSSIALALLRAIKTEGKVYYDNLATDEMNLDALRENVTLIPQQPELIHGTLRENLDPFGQHDDATLNDALHAAGFFSTAEMSTNKDPISDSTGHDIAGYTSNVNIGLDTMVESGGTNFSVGQRQIIALARAVIRRTKLLILDEATAAIDYDTDAMIQKTLRSAFSADTTLITIAHRLQTIVDYDKIMVLEAGELVEYDSPNALVAKEGGYFRALVDESEDRDRLRALVDACQ